MQKRRDRQRKEDIPTAVVLLHKIDIIARNQLLEIRQLIPATEMRDSDTELLVNLLKIEH
jgi:hypothetical protein